MIRLEELPNPLPRNWEMEIFLTLVGAGEHLDAHVKAFEYDPSYMGDRYQVLAKASVVFEVGEIDIPGIQIESLKKEKQKILADAHVKAEQIEQQIQSLLAIEYRPETDGAA